ncbi:cyclodeaminase/cyclohydrolase family protein [Candidatus Microgenomates bacterium]|nr:cyclodeaminase/cyclohydrolase family protein [Candidatus Microgenomates bacterium]
MSKRKKSITKQTVESFVKDIASGKPTPGGGAVAAFTGATAAALVEMVCTLTIGKKEYGRFENKLQNIQKNSLEYRKKLLKLADDDVAAFTSVMEGYRSGDKEKIKRSLKRAMEVSMEVKKLVTELQKMAITVSKFGNKNAISDAKTAIYLCGASGKSAWENVKINKQALKNL